MKRWLAVLVWSALIVLSAAYAVNDDELLDPELAFALTASTPDADTLIVEWEIAPAYYMYRDRFQFESDTPGIRLGEPRFPPGKIKEDEFFGQVEIYRERVAVEIPLFRDPNAPEQLALHTVSQGCADSGVCYMPQKQSVTVALLPAATTSTSFPTTTTGGGALQSTGDLISALTGGNNLSLTPSQDALLSPEQAFIPTLSATGADILRAEWLIAEDTYLYRDRFAFASLTPGITLGEPLFPAGELHEDEFFGRVEIYRGRVAVDIPVIRDANAPEQLDVRLDYQGCADIGVCYMPQSETLPIILAALPAAPIVPSPTAISDAAEPPSVVTESSAEEAIDPNAPPQQIAISEQDQIAQMLVQQRFWSLPAFFGFGLLLAFTPCVFPMIPILSSIIVGQGENLTQRHAFGLSLIYVMAMALTYTVAGVLAAMLGQNIQAIFQNPWVLSVFSGMFVLLALSMFGFYDLQLPTSWQSKLSEFSNRQSSGTYAGVAIMGLLSALIVGPCVAAPLIGVLTVIASTGDTVLGGSALFIMSLGMGAPLLAIGTSAGKLMPRAGMWMDAVKSVFGVLLLAVAIWMLERILPEAAAMLLWAMLFIVSATYMGALQSLDTEASSWRSLVRGVGVVFLVYGMLMLIGVAAGGKDTLQPLRGVGLFAGNPVQSLPVNANDS